MSPRNRFKELWIEHRRVPLKEIAEATQIDYSILSKIKNNPYYNISLKNIGKLCEFFKCEPGDLIVVENKDNSLTMQKPSESLITNPSTAKASQLLRENKDNYFCGINFGEVVSSLSPQQRDNLLVNILKQVADALGGVRRTDK